MNGICQARAITEAFGTACDVDQNSNFYMKMASDQADASGQVFITVINDSTCDPASTSCTVPGNNTDELRDIVADIIKECGCQFIRV